MADSLAAIVLAAGFGTRLFPLTRLRPKPLCPVLNVPLIDLALERVAPVTRDVAVNVHAGRDLMESHLAGRVHLSIEEDQPLGTAGAVGHLREWIGGRGVLVTNADSWHHADLAAFAAGWDGERVRLLVAGDPSPGLTTTTKLCGILLPGPIAAALPDEPAWLYSSCLQPAAAEGRLDLAGYDGPFHDCGTPREYLAANMAASGGEPVVGGGSVIEGTLERSVVWPASYVRSNERLVDAIRAGDRLTVLVR